ncbi:MAG: hypothetical protein KAH01_03100 [Caldisericia bacterium]|nr:hypothetical protein [Caldisericia bacterium]
MKYIYTIILAIAIPSIVSAVPAFTGTIEFKQADNSTFSAKMQGDEWFNWIEDKKGNIITFNPQTKSYEYGIIKKVDGALELVPSGIQAADKPLISNASSNTIEKIDRATLQQIWKEKREKASSHK